MKKILLSLSLLFSISTLRVLVADTLSGQITGWNFDWDDNVLNMPTKIVIFKKNTAPKTEVAVSTADFAIIRLQLGQPGPYQDYESNDDPVNGSFRYFRDGRPGKNYFLEDIQKATANPKDHSWQGPCWKKFVEALSHKESAEWTTIITARGHSPKTMYEGLEYLLKKHYLKTLPPAENLYGVSGPQYKGASAADPSAIKATIMKTILDKIEDHRSPLPMLDVINREGSGVAKLNLWGFSDDDYGNYSKAVEVLGPEVKKGRWPHIKISLFYTGTKKQGEVPHSVVIRPDGLLRPRLPKEELEINAILH